MQTPDPGFRCSAHAALIIAALLFGSTLTAQAQASVPVPLIKENATVKVVGSHREMGDATLISEYRGYLKSIEARVRELKSEGKSSDEAAKLLTAEFQAKYPDWAAPVRIAGAVQAFYADR